NLLKNYKGELVVSEELENDEFVSELIFDNKPYLKKAVFESFYRFLTNGNFRDCNLLIFDENFMFKNKLCGIIPYVKSLTVIVKSNFDYLLWQGSCFAEYGVKPLVLEKEPESLDSFDIIANFNEFADERVVVSVKNQNQSFYPDYKYLQVPDELKILEGYNVKNSLLCAAFKQI
ncbi:MAG: hypothetical protein IKC01_02035, partial [Clostridia bacterium]|nr:hypothetical protein [Clostridia bacterium]